MAEVTYRPAHVKGEVRIPPSKSAAHRALLSAALCKTPCRVGPIDHSADMEATLNGVCAMGGMVKAEENGVLCIAPGTAPQSVTVNCGESGSTLRFLIPVFAALGIEVTIQSQDWNVFLEERKNGNYDFCREGWLADFNDPINMLEMWITDSGNNDCQYGRVG